MPKTLSPELKHKYNELRQSLQSMKRLIVAFSGGVDSSLVAFVATQELGHNAKIVTSASKSLKRSDLALTKELAKSWNLNHEVILTDELSKQGYRNNPTNRCYFCKTSLYTALANLAEREGYDHIVNGTNTDDLGDHRPGLEAARNHSVSSPLVDAGFTKNDIRSLSKFLGLENAHKPQAACLSSRVPYGTKIDEDILNRIERAENVLAVLGFSQFRVRHHEDVARIELLPEEMPRAIELNFQISESLKEFGYRFVTIDLSGFKSGSLNVGLVPVAEVDS